MLYTNPQPAWPSSKEENTSACGSRQLLAELHRCSLLLRAASRLVLRPASQTTCRTYQRGQISYLTVAKPHMHSIISGLRLLPLLVLLAAAIAFLLETAAANADDVGEASR